MVDSLEGCLEFGHFGLDIAGGRLFRFDVEHAPVPVALGARALALLCVLAGRPGTVVAKEAIMDAVWPDTTVEEKNLAVQISTLRQALDAKGAKKTGLKPFRAADIVSWHRWTARQNCRVDRGQRRSTRLSALRGDAGWRTRGSD